MGHHLAAWTIEVRALATELRAGAFRRQAASVDITVRALAPAFPQTIEDCIDYQPICEHVLGAWSDTASGEEPELALRALAAFILGRDGRIVEVDVGLSSGGVSLRLSQAGGHRQEALLAA